jgi:hypothetical protein
MSRGRCPLSHAEFQKFAFVPSPKVMVVQLAKRRLSSSVHVTSIPTHGLSGEAHSCQSQRMCRVVANLFRLRTPRPPYSFDRVVLV